MLNKQHLLAAGAGALLFAGAGAATAALADTTTSAATAPAVHDCGPQGGMFDGQGVAGKVTAVSGSTIMVESTSRKDNTTTTYTIDASAAAVDKGPDATGSISDVTVGSFVMAEGTVNGTSVTATKLHVGGGEGGPGMGGRGHGVHGTVSAVSGSTLTITATDRDGATTTYTVDASSAKVSKASEGQKPTETTLASVAVGDEVMVAGEVNGTSITAKMIMDGVPPKGAPAPTQN